ncbi:LacI family DNA-binding transcriptional regulator [Bacillus taeanensis]|uniref:LacI family transcriptional regulator n=1 Tax=Bacillus taeanensis TaxID=273032 RepID=A0A366XRP8_9BACI|nr:LacI family DNA-binding transcriptional regulator [Bacillus taeanensis]RBW69040.1 LacI family transcriptional regulator [Bacillus taeanensis]
MKATIYDVAKNAGVSIATVSKVINNNGRISDKTRKKVLKIMKDLDYQPSFAAAALTGKRTNTIGLLIPDLANPFFAEIARSIEDRGHELGVSVVMCSTDKNKEKEEKYVSLLVRKSVDGFILASGFSNVEVVEDLLKKKIPVAMIAQDVPTLLVDTLSVDDYKGGYLATVHLLSLEHKRIAVIGEVARSSDDRIRGYKEALQQSGHLVHDDYIVRSESSIEGGRKAADHLLNQSNPPTAIFACNDLLAIGVIQAVQARGLVVPNDVSIIGFDNTILATTSDPALTTIAQPIHEMGQFIMDLLIQEIEGKKTVKRRMLLLPELVVRNSTAKPSVSVEKQLT